MQGVGQVLLNIGIQPKMENLAVWDELKRILGTIPENFFW